MTNGYNVRRLVNETTVPLFGLYTHAAWFVRWCKNRGSFLTGTNLDDVWAIGSIYDVRTEDLPPSETKLITVHWVKILSCSKLIYKVNWPWTGTSDSNFRFFDTTSLIIINTKSPFVFIYFSLSSFLSSFRLSKSPHHLHLLSFKVTTFSRCKINGSFDYLLFLGLVT